MKTKTAVLNGKPDAGNPHVRFDEGEVASAKPMRGSLLYKSEIDQKRREDGNRQILISAALFCACLTGATGVWASDWQYAEGKLTALNGVSEGMVLSVASAGDAKLTVTDVTDWNGEPGTIRFVTTFPPPGMLMIVR